MTKPGMQFGRVAAILSAGVLGLVLLSGCAASGTAPGTAESSPVSQAMTIVPASTSPALATVDTAAEQSAAGQAAAAAQVAAAEAARVAAEQAAAADQSVAVQASADAAQRAADALYAAGWYDERGWVSPESAARARAAGIAAGASVPDDLRCGTICGESPTSGELQQQWLDEQDPLNPDGSLSETCDGYSSGGTCYPSYQDAATACGGYLIRGNCYPSEEAARAAGEGE